ncbi:MULTISPECIES: FMN-binding negative transcriptional regulator [unclassified Microbulbifer]|uniref:FMN-binding negative transcriptional regulator n=1 Tax=unclassified Microbulbifer TaxID=2619833 RepID=UPI0027E59EE7|nr:MULTISPECIES: FMN-binding negative transcriptional regulator [unclassified Microbulbifer]
MYIPSSFRQEDMAALHQLMRDRPLATLVTSSPDGPNANHIPLQLVAEPGSRGVLRGHIARANPLAREAEEPLQALAIFCGPDSYISPSWYPEKVEHGKVVPTWNYVAVHARGSLRIVEEPHWLREQLEGLTGQKEAGAPSPWSVADAPEDFIEKLSAAIVGIELSIDTLEGKWKVSQNQRRATREGVAGGLRERAGDGDGDMAALVESAVGD